MSVFNRQAGQDLIVEVQNEAEHIRGEKLAQGLLNQINTLHSKDRFSPREVDELLLKEKAHELATDDFFKNNNKYDLYFSPSSASKCKRELYYKALREKKDSTLLYPYHRRWTRNASFVHEAIQRDLLMCEYVLPADELMFKVKRLANGLPAWERNIAQFKEIEHNGVKFAMYGMCDGILTYVKDYSDVLFEAKTKSTPIASVGTYKLKDIQEEHKTQATAYAIMFGVNEAVFYYESLAKDGWTKGADARSDIRTFYHKVTEDDKIALLDKFAEVATAVRNKELPDAEFDKCFFCSYKTQCKNDSM